MSVWSVCVYNIIEKMYKHDSKTSKNRGSTVHDSKRLIYINCYIINYKLNNITMIILVLSFWTRTIFKKNIHSQKFADDLSSATVIQYNILLDVYVLIKTLKLNRISYLLDTR